jgi:hypothetical protein
MDWIIDGKINLTKTMEQAGWSLALGIEALMAIGLSYRDAQDFAHFAISEKAIVRDEDEKPEDFVSDAQWARLSLL